MSTPLQKRKLMGDINVVPMIDVMLVLLVVFMITAPLLTQGIEVDLPEASAAPIEAPPDKDPLVLSVDADGNLYINYGEDKEQPKAGAKNVEIASIVIDSQEGTPVYVKADRAVPYGNVVGAMVLLQQAGATNIGFVTDPLESYPIPE